MDPFIDSLPRFQQSLAALLILSLAGTPVLVLMAGVVSLLFPSAAVIATACAYLFAVMPSTIFYLGVRAVSRAPQ